MKVGDLIKFRNIDSSWGKTGLIIEIRITEIGTGMITMITKVGSQCTIPWANRNTYIEEVTSGI